MTSIVEATIEILKDRPAAEAIVTAIGTYLDDPPDTDFQQGYLMALIAVGELYMSEQERIDFRARWNKPIVLKQNKE
jgi:hypothetical protein